MEDKSISVKFVVTRWGVGEGGSQLMLMLEGWGEGLVASKE